MTTAFQILLLFVVFASAMYVLSRDTTKGQVLPTLVFVVSVTLVTLMIWPF